MREELAQKKCFAQLLCRREAHKFYNEKVVPQSNGRWQLGMMGIEKGLEGQMGQSKVSCSTIVEVFAKPENEMMIPEGSITKDDRRLCKKITHELATCLAKKRKQ